MKRNLKGEMKRHVTASCRTQEPPIGNYLRNYKLMKRPTSKVLFNFVILGK
jgi:hypothetical protein